MIECPNCRHNIGVPAYIDRSMFDGQLRCWDGCKLLWNVSLRSGSMSIKVEESLFPAVDAVGGRFN